MNMIQFKGPGVFGRAYRIMMERDTHASGSIDRMLAENMVRLSPETADYLYGSFTPLGVLYDKGSRPELERILTSQGLHMSDPEQSLAAIVEFTRGLGARAEQDLHLMRVGGTEEEIIRRGSGWCADVARVACALCQVAGFPSRVVYLFDLSRAYSGHVIIEAFRAGKWGALDAGTGVVYVTAGGAPASTWELMNDASLVEFNRKDPKAFYTTAEQFLSAGIANYFCWERGQYDYTITGLNDYCLSILTMCNNGWPGGLRWLHGEEA